jgi:hypothetical protein
LLAKLAKHHRSTNIAAFAPSCSNIRIFKDEEDHFPLLPSPNDTAEITARDGDGEGGGRKKSIKQSNSTTV